MAFLAAGGLGLQLRNASGRSWYGLESDALVRQQVYPVELESTLSLYTGYPGNNVVEPSVLFDPSAPFFASADTPGYEFVACAGAYYKSDALYENPSLWVSHDGDTWVNVVFSAGIGMPEPGYGGIVAPIVLSGVQGDGELSDPYLVRGGDGTYYVLWNQFLRSTRAGGTGTNGLNWSVKGISASSLVGPWSAPVTVFASNLSSFRPASPSAVWIPSLNRWQIYCVDLSSITATTVIRFDVADTNLLGEWTPPATPKIAMPPGYGSQLWWHLNAYRTSNRLFLLVQDTAAGTSDGGNLWIVFSDDNGVTWSVPATPILAGTSFYRSALAPGRRGMQVGFELFYGYLASGFSLGRGFVYRPFPSSYGTIGAHVPASFEAAPPDAPGADACGQTLA